MALAWLDRVLGLLIAALAAVALCRRVPSTALTASLAPETPRAVLRQAARALRAAAASSGFQSVRVTSGGIPVVVAFDEVARAIDEHDLLTNVPVRLAPPSEPPLSPVERPGGLR